MDFTLGFGERPKERIGLIHDSAHPFVDRHQFVCCCVVHGCLFDNRGVQFNVVFTERENQRILNAGAADGQPNRFGCARSSNSFLTGAGNGASPIDASFHQT